MFRLFPSVTKSISRERFGLANSLWALRSSYWAERHKEEAKEKIPEPYRFPFSVFSCKKKQQSSVKTLLMLLPTGTLQKTSQDLRGFSIWVQKSSCSIMRICLQTFQNPLTRGTCSVAHTRHSFCRKIYGRKIYVVLRLLIGSGYGFSNHQ